MYYLRYIAYFFIAVLFAVAGGLIYKYGEIDLLSGTLLGIAALGLLLVLLRPLFVKGLKEAVEEGAPERVPPK